MDHEKVDIPEVNRAKANFEEFRKHGTHLEHRKVDALPGIIQKVDVEGEESIADREMRRMQNNDVFRSNVKTVKEQSDTQKARYDWGPSKAGRKYESK
jgi:hypothetical protein